MIISDIFNKKDFKKAIKQLKSLGYHWVYGKGHEDHLDICWKCKNGIRLSLEGDKYNYIWIEHL